MVVNCQCHDHSDDDESGDQTDENHDASEDGDDYQVGGDSDSNLKANFESLSPPTRKECHGSVHSGCTAGVTEVFEPVEVPSRSSSLSATEQENFQELCVIPDWDREPSECGEDAMVLDVDPCPPQEEDVPMTATATRRERPDRPLRRSKRVADALAAAQQAPPPQPSRTRSHKGGSRNSLS